MIESLLTRALLSYGEALSIADPIRLRFWGKRGQTIAQLRLMYALLLSGGRPVGDLAEEFNVRPPTVTGLTNRLVRQKLIERHSDPSDRRIVRVDLTNEGRRVLAEIEAASRAFLGEILDRMGEEKVKQLVAILDEFTLAARAVQQESEFVP